ncbi:MAG: hypothetical protein R3B90_09855 [Planctomycetaceae bacterium]
MSDAGVSGAWLLVRRHRVGRGGAVVIRRFRISSRQLPHRLWFAALAVVLAIKHRVAPVELPEQITFFNTSFAYELARFLIFLSGRTAVRQPAGAAFPRGSPGSRASAWCSHRTCG